MKKVKLVLTKLIISYVIIYVLLGMTASCFAVSYDSSCGQYVSQYSREFIATYCTPESKTVYDCSSAYASWSGGAMGQGIFHCCCTAGVQYMYQLALGINLYDYGFHGMCGTALSQMKTSPYWTEITSESQLQAGDIVINSGHTELYIGNNQRANFGNYPYSGVVRSGPSLTSSGGSFTNAFRLTGVDVDPAGSITATSMSNVNYSDFYFNGIPDGKYSLAHTSILSKIIETLASIADYLIGIITYIIRMVVVGWTAIFDNLFNWTVNTVVDTGTEPEDLNISSIEIDSSDSDTRITMEKMIYNMFDFLNINIFR